MTDEIIFHHYPTSPFSEKVRLAFGMKGMKWRAVVQPVIMPKPYLTVLTGGYRKIPVMQIGADIYCDTQIILSEIERRVSDPPIMQGGMGQAVGFWADRSFFQASVPLIFGALGDKVDPAFMKDREALSGRPFDVAQMKAAVPLMREQWRAHVGFIESALQSGGDFINGTPGVEDIHAHMNVWFVSNFVAEEAVKLLAEFPRVRAWYQRLNAIGHGTPSDMTPEDAVKVARDAVPHDKEHEDPHEPNGLKPGQKVMVMADDYGRDPITGTLVSSSMHRISIARTDEQAGDVVVHFPRAGFWVMPAA
jgi:glutathione S-transferase